MLKNKLTIISKKIAIIFPALVMSFFVRADALAAGLSFKEGNENAVVNFYLVNRKYLERQTTFSSFGRSILGFLAKTLSSISDGAFKLYNSVFDFLDFKTFSNFLNLKTGLSERALVTAILSVSLLALGVMVIFGDRKKLSPIKSLFIAICVFAAGGSLLSTADGLVRKIRTSLVGNRNSIASQAVWGNTFDLASFMKDKPLSKLSTIQPVLDPNKHDLSGNLKQGSAAALKMMDNKQYVYTEQEIEGLEVNAIMWAEDVERENDQEILSHYITKSPGGQGGTYVTGGSWPNYTYGSKTGSSGGVFYSIHEIPFDEDDMGVMKAIKIMSEGGAYYMYAFNWLPMIIRLVSSIIVYILMAYKTFRLIMEIAVGEILAVIQAPQIHNTKKMVDVLVGIRDAYITLILTMLFLRIYELLLIFIDQLNRGDKYGGVIIAFLTIFASMFVIDGPNIAQKITGQDAGLKSAWGAVAGTALAGRMITRTAKTANRAAGNAVGTVAGTHKPQTGLGKIAGFIPGAPARMSEQEKKKAAGMREAKNAENMEKAAKGSMMAGQAAQRTDGKLGHAMTSGENAKNINVSLDDQNRKVSGGGAASNSRTSDMDNASQKGFAEGQKDARNSSEEIGGKKTDTGRKIEESIDSKNKESGLSTGASLNARKEMDESSS